MSLWAAAVVGRSDEVARLLAEGANIQETTPLGSSALHGAAEEGHVKVVECLLHARADINLKTRIGYTPLHIAAKQGRTFIVQALLDNGADINVVTNDGMSPMQCASYWGYYELSAILRAEAARRAAWVAFAMGQHPRLGAKSLVLGLESGVIRLILDPA